MNDIQDYVPAHPRGPAPQKTASAELVKFLRNALLAVAAGLICTAANAERVPEPLESVKLDDLCLVSTEPSPDGLRGTLRDKAGKLHPVQVGGYAGRNAGRVKSITADEVLVHEVLRDLSGSEAEREWRLKLCSKKRGSGDKDR